jgi:hypothetical protein
MRGNTVSVKYSIRNDARHSGPLLSTGTRERPEFSAGLKSGHLEQSRGDIEA